MQSLTGDVPAQTMKQFKMVDLHGNSISQSRASVNKHIEIAYHSNTRGVRFVTGRGNHVNSRGERGTQHREFRTWISPENQARISEIREGDGFYEITVKPGKKDLTFYPFLEKMTDQWMRAHKEEIIKSANEGDADSQNILGHCYEYGVGFEVDYQQAAWWYQKAADQNNKFAQYALGGCYWQGKGVRQNDQAAIELFKAAAAQNFAWAVHHLGEIYDMGWGKDCDPKLALSYYQRAADLGLDIAKRKLAHALLRGEYIPKDETKALQLYKEVADRGDGHAAYNTAFCFMKGLGTPINYPMAFKYAKQSADLNDPDAQFLVATFYGQGLGTEVNAALSLKYLQSSADNHFKHALFQLAFHPNFKEDRLQKVNYFIAAAKAGHIVAQAMVLNQFPQSLLSPTEREDLLNDFWKQDDSEVHDIQDPSGHFQSIVIDAYMSFDQLTHKQKQKIMRLLTELAKQNILSAFGRLGFIYSNNKIVTQDHRKTEQYWRKGSELGCKECSCSLGYFYEQGWGGKVENEKSFQFHSLGAKQGSANSHNQLGLYYKNGTGGRKDLPRAIEHFKQAMALDNKETSGLQRSGLFYTPTYPHAAFNLGMLFWNGDQLSGFSKDVNQALYWFNDAAEHGSEDAVKLLEKLGMKMVRQDSYQNTQNVSFWKTPNATDRATSSVTNTAAASVSADGSGNSANNAATKAANNTSSRTPIITGGSSAGNTSNSTTPNNSNNMTKQINLLNEFTALLNFKVEWQFPSNDIAWGYIEDSVTERVKQYADILKPIEIKKSQAGRSLLVLKEVSKQDIHLIIEKLMQHGIENKARISRP